MLPEQELVEALARIEELEERIRELEALYNHELSCGRTVRESNRKLKGELQALREAKAEQYQLAQYYRAALQ